MKKWIRLIVVGMALLGLSGRMALAQEVAIETATIAASADEVTVAPAMFTADNLWMLVATLVVFTMHLGFAMLEAGLTRAKSTVSILFKSALIVAIGLLTHTLPEGGGTSAYNVGYIYWTDFILQGMFAATAAMIVSGAVGIRSGEWQKSLLNFRRFAVRTWRPFETNATHSVACVFVSRWAANKGGTF